MALFKNITSRDVSATSLCKKIYESGLWLQAFVSAYENNKKWDDWVWLEKSKSERTWRENVDHRRDFCALKALH